MRGIAPFVFGALLSACTTTEAPSPVDGDDVQVLSINTFLGQLDPISVTDDAGVTREYGGLAALASYFAQDRAAVPNTLLLLGPDSFGASPALSAQFHDEPTIEGLGYLGGTCDTLSNHDFDNGIPYLENLIDLSSYPYVASNLSGLDASIDAPVQAPYLLVHAGATTLGVLGITSPDAPNHTSPGAFGPITITEPATSANAAAEAARAAGAATVLVVTDLATTAVDAAGNRSGPLIDFVNGLHGIDVVLGYNQTNPGTVRLGDVLLVEHTWKGMTYGRTRIHVNGDATVTVTADVVLPDISAVTPDPKAVALLAPYRAQLVALYDSSVSVTTGTFPLDGTERVGESAIGDVVADSFLARYASQGAQIAIFNGAGIRDSLPSSYTPSDKTLRRPAPGFAPGPPFDVVVGDAYTILPFGDTCVVRTITGATLWQALEQSVFQAPTPFTGFLQIAGFRFVYQASAQPGARVQSVTLDDGTDIPRDDTRLWTLIDTDYLDTGGDGYGMLVESPVAPTRDVAAEVLLDYFQETAPLVPAVGDRITAIP